MNYTYARVYYDMHVLYSKIELCFSSLALFCKTSRQDIVPSKLTYA